MSGYEWTNRLGIGARMLLAYALTFAQSAWAGQNQKTKDKADSPQKVDAEPPSNAPSPSPAPPPSPAPRLRGFVDLHTHPFDNVAFGGKLLYGGVDGYTDAQGNPQGSFLPTDPNCQHNVLAGSREEALGHDRSTHGGPVVRYVDPLHPAYDFNPCGNPLRAKIIHAIQNDIGLDHPEDSCGLAYPTQPTPNSCSDVPFNDWPTWNDVTHQKMWIDWILRAYAGGLRVMVALATNSKLLGDVVTVGNISSTGDLATDDKSSTDLQISEIKRFVGNHSDWMQVAYNSQDVFNIVSSNKLAVVIGVEVDQIGNFKPASPPSDADIRAEIDRLYNEGVRYIFPTHIVDTVFSGTAVNEDLFDLANLYEDGALWNLTCANNPQTDMAIKYQLVGDIGKLGADFAAQLNKLGLPTLHGDPSCGCFGQKNAVGLKPAGQTALQEMMRLGMLIDIDHMSQQAEDDTLAFASRPDVRYPVMSGHSAVRGDENEFGASTKPPTERNLRPDQYKTIGALHGMAGVGNVEVDAWTWLKMYNHVVQLMCQGAGTPGDNCLVSDGFGTDTNGLQRGSPPPSGHPQLNLTTTNLPISSWKGFAQTPLTQLPTLPMCCFGPKTWNYDTVGFAHYGLLPDFLADARNMKTVDTGGKSGSDLVDGNVLNGADYFYHTWQIAESRSKCLLTPACILAIINPPESSIVSLGQTARFVVTASGAAPLSYQWRKNGTPIINGATSSSYVTPPVTISDLGAQFDVVVSDLVHSVTSSSATITGLLSVEVCPTLDGKTCTSFGPLGRPSGAPVMDTVTVTSGGEPVPGATVSVTPQPTFTAVTDSSGSAVINHLDCYAPGQPVPKVGQTNVPVHIPSACPATVTRSGFQTFNTTLP